MSNKKANTDNIDYLTEDPIISSQKWVCLSFLKPSQIEEKYRPQDLTVCGLKVRGSYDTYEEAQKRADWLRTIDDKHNIYIAEVGKWCPFEDNPEKAKDSEYMNKDLNNLMKNYWKQQDEAKQFHETRKQEMVTKAIKEVEQKKQENSTVDSSTDLEIDSKIGDQADDQLHQKKPNANKVKKAKKDKNVKVEEMKNILDEDKKKLDDEKKEINENIDLLRKLEEELAQKIKEMEDEGITPPHLNKIDL